MALSPMCVGDVVMLSAETEGRGGLATAAQKWFKRKENAPESATVVKCFSPIILMLWMQQKSSERKISSKELVQSCLLL